MFQRSLPACEYGTDAETGLAAQRDFLRAADRDHDQYERDELLPRHRDRFRRAGHGDRPDPDADAFDRRADDGFVDRYAGDSQRRNGHPDAGARVGRDSGRGDRADHCDGSSAGYADYGGECFGRCDGGLRGERGRDRSAAGVTRCCLADRRLCFVR